MSENIKHSAHAILAEARETIEITYWVQSKEYEFANWEDVVNLPKHKEVTLHVHFDPDHDEYEDDDVIKTSDKGERKAAITGVCSLGAIALATYTLYDVPLAEYSNMQDRDPYTALANALLNDAICRMEPDYLNGYGLGGEIVATWNDETGRTREEVLALFDKALDNPIAKKDEAWHIGFSYYGGYKEVPLLFVTEQEAKDYATLVMAETQKYIQDETRNYRAPDEVINYLVRHIGSADWKPVRALANQLASA